MSQALRGHPLQRRILARTLREHHLPQGFCFVGPQGVGKRLTASRFIAFDFCANPSADAESLQACGECAPCQRVLKNAHPDLIAPVPDGSLIKIEQVRDIQRQMRFRPLYARRRWVLIDNADCLTEQSQNALLHTLEEPGAETHFILITTHEELLLATIRSRTRTIRFGTLPAAEVRQILKDNGVSESDLDAHTRLANGCPGQVTRWLSEELRDLRQELLQLLCGLPLMKTTDERNWAALRMSQKLSGHKPFREQLNETILTFFRDLAFSRMHLPESELRDFLVNGDFAAQFAKLPAIPFSRVISSYQAARQLSYDFDVHVNPELTYNRFFLELTGVGYGQ